MVPGLSHYGQCTDCEAGFSFYGNPVGEGERAGGAMVTVFQI